MILLALLNEASTFINRDEDNIIASSSIYQQKKPSEKLWGPLNWINCFHFMVFLTLPKIYIFSSSSTNCDGWIWSRALGSILQSWIQFGSNVSSGSFTGPPSARYYRMATRQTQVVKIKFYVWTKVITYWSSRVYQYAICSHV